MTAPRRWLRLDVTWSASAWVSGLRPGARLAWIELLGYVKAYGVGGTAKGLTASAAARRWSIGPKDVSQMITAAIADDALRIEPNGDWVVVNFGRYQEVDTTAAERMRKHRALRRNVTNEAPENGARPPRKDPLRRNSRNVRDVPSRDRDVDSDGDRTAGEHARAHESPAASVNGGTPPPDFDGYQPTDAQRGRAAELRVDLTSALIKWRGNRKSGGLIVHDLAGDFDEWLEREPGYANGTGAHTPSPNGAHPPKASPMIPVDRHGKPVLVDHPGAHQDDVPVAKLVAALATTIGPKPPDEDPAKVAAVKARIADEKKRLVQLRRSGGEQQIAIARGELKLPEAQ